LVPPQRPDPAPARVAVTQPSIATTSRDADDSGIPPGWSVNPSTWGQRLPIIVLAICGTIAAGWLALYQQEVVDTVWEPFFGDGTTEIVRESSFSQAFERFPVGDAALGAVGYLADAVFGAIGGTKRWRTMPWIVIVFGAFVGPFGAISVMLTIFQPVLYDNFCTLCLFSGVVSLAMIGPGVDEVLASLQHMRREHRDGKSLWRVFWGLES
jgi:hypothetical protein